jgi:hypothetical protein
MVGFLQAILTYPKKLIRERLNTFEKLTGVKQTSRNSYQGMKRMRLEIFQIERKLPKVPKYSGYVKTPSSVGSKSSSKVRLPEPTSEPEYYLDKEFDWFHILTVGEIPLFGGQSILMMP